MSKSNEVYNGRNSTTNSHMNLEIERRAGYGFKDCRTNSGGEPSE